MGGACVFSGWLCEAGGEADSVFGGFAGFDAAAEFPSIFSSFCGSLSSAGCSAEDRSSLDDISSVLSSLVVVSDIISHETICEEVPLSAGTVWLSHPERLTTSRQARIAANIFCLFIKIHLYLQDTEKTEKVQRNPKIFPKRLQYPHRKTMIFIFQGFFLLRWAVF